MKTKKKNIKSRFIVLVCFVVILPVVWILVIRLEGEKPSITLKLPSPSIGKTQELSLTVSDAKSGVRRTCRLQVLFAAAWYTSHLLRSRLSRGKWG